ncbi:malate:quinone oxidoreductase, partial [Nocardia sp. NPDC004582]
FVGAGGYALKLLQRARVPEVRGYGVFPVAAPGEIHRRPERVPHADPRPIQRCPDRAAPPPALRTLGSDPALHRTESGRRLLDLLAVVPADPATWAELICDLPPYQAAFLAELAAEQAENWSALARAATRQAVTEETTAA